MFLNYITCRFSSLHLGLFIFLFSLANSGVLPHIAGSDTALWIEPTSKPASHSDSCVFHYNTVNSMGYFRFQLNVAVILSLNPLFTLALLFICILDLCTLLNTEDFTCNTLFFFISSRRSWRPRICCTLWQNLPRTGKSLVSGTIYNGAMQIFVPDMKYIA